MILIGVIVFSFQSVAGNLFDKREHASFPFYVPQKQDWNFSGPFGIYDKAQLRCGFKVYKKVCASCDGLKYVSFRDLKALSYDQEQIKAFASQYEVSDGPNKEGKFFKRSGIASDYFLSPFSNIEEAKFMHNGVEPADLSLMTRTRFVSLPFPALITDVLTNYNTVGPDYITALLTGYQEAPKNKKIAKGYWYNPYFIAGDVLAMVPPLKDGLVSYEDGTQETVEHYARDVSSFLMWAADPYMEIRKKTGFHVILFLIIFGVLYSMKRRIWHDLDKNLKRNKK
ncbi:MULTISPECIES: cytochrome c1 [unclassified Bartonella]|uniref:cytochrome c1 n=1 Tax=unclassified Bartonella TaxID=2645622 RepID=UPI0009C3D834|nr:MULTISPECIES: cytochrome c1 [unclassified Bartonella]AQX27593.1 ubiquinol-cytochrome c reductase cytochrome c1 subunit [Bartonella sp. JB15]AQX28874.1 ubiquinol-cytochrome c reductase cytochrome c1 subunit [Bartonella sp. JB63]